MSKLTIIEQKALAQAELQAIIAQKNTELVAKNKEAARDILLKINAIYARIPLKG